MTHLVGKHPFITVRVKLQKTTKWHRLDCMIDTGFSGGLILPENLQKYFNPEQFIEAHFLLADESEITVSSTYTLVEFYGKRKDVAIVFMGNSGGLAGIPTARRRGKSRQNL